MEYGLIGAKLGHSFSPEIHEAFGRYSYGLKELTESELETFLRAKDFKGINVTIPYKQAVIPFLDEIDPAAAAIGAVNTVICRGGKLLGRNTDFYGMKSLFSRAGVDPSGKTAAILGTGGTSKTATAVLNALSAAKVLTVSRSGRDGSISYEQLYERAAEIEILVNTTPCGMYPDDRGCPVDLSRFPAVKGVIDAVYHPLRTNLIVQAQNAGIPAEGGLWMLVAQAASACGFFLGEELPETETRRVFEILRREKENIVLIGMPGSGKTTVGTILARELGRPFYDLDQVLTEETGKTPDRMIREEGEAAFRDSEAEICEKVAEQTGAVIACGGGTVLRQSNTDALRRNGTILFLDRPIGAICVTEDRPLSATRELLEQRYRERYPIYTKAARRRICPDGGPERAAEQIRKELGL